MRAITRVVGASAAAALALTLAACGSSDDGSSADPSGDTTTSSARTEDTPTSTPDDEKEAASGDLTADSFYTVLASAMQDGTSYPTTTTSGLGISSTVQGAVVITDGVPAMSMTMSGGGVDSQIVLVDNTYYMNMGELSGGKFLVIDLADSSNPLGASLGSVKDLGDPEKSISMLKDTVTSVEKVGQEDVGGVSATHYKVALDGSAAAASVIDALGDADPTGLSSLPTEFVYDFWVDGDGRPAKMATEFGGVSTEATYSDWNDPSIKVEKPSGDQLSDLTFQDLLGGASS